LNTVTSCVRVIDYIGCRAQDLSSDIGPIEGWVWDAGKGDLGSSGINSRTIKIDTVRSGGYYSY
jgi:hypothetical protein